MVLNERKLADVFSRNFLRNISWNLFGQIAPFIAALICIPLLINGLGVDRFGILTIAWMIIGYFSFFDLGIGRALTQIISEKFATDEEEEIPVIIWTGLCCMLLLGLIASLTLVIFSEWLVYSVLRIPLSLQSETVHSLYMLAPAIPFVVLATGLRGILEAKNHFKSINIVRIPLGIMLFVAPVIVLKFSNNLVLIFLSLFVVRFLTFLVFYLLSKRIFKNLFEFKFSLNVMPELLRFGGWMTISNIVSPIMVQMDRFFIGSILSMAAVSYYSTSYEMVTKLLIIPGAISGVCFPIFAKLYAQKKHKDGMQLYWKSCKYIFMSIFPIVIGMMLFANLILKLWLGDEFAREGTVVFQILAVGVLINGLAHVPFSYLQGCGRSDLTAKTHLFELTIYLPSIFICINMYGITGAAAAWTVRVLIDAVILHKLVMMRLIKYKLI